MTPRELRDAAVVIAEQHLPSTAGRLNQLLLAIRDGQLKLKVHRPTAPRKRKTVVLPAWLPEPAWERFVLHRQQLGAPLTELGADKAIEELEALRKAGHKPEAVIEQSISRGWRGLFAVKGGPNDRRDRVPVLGKDDVF